MKDVMTTVINTVIDQRSQKIKRDISTTIQLSAVFMDKWLTEVYDHTKVKWSDMKDVEITRNNMVWTIRNRSYRDDTNDSDVEEALYNLAQTL